jgi:hypothetical protein
VALSASVLSGLIRTKVEARTGHEMRDAAVEVWDAVAEAIVEHIQASAVVTVASVSGVTPGSGVSGPGTGTIS